MPSSQITAVNSEWGRGDSLNIDVMWCVGCNKKKLRCGGTTNTHQVYIYIPHKEAFKVPSLLSSQSMK